MQEVIKNKELKFFGIVWILFLSLSLYFNLFGEESTFVLIILLSFLTIFTFFAPRRLTIPFKLWLKFGEFMGKIVTTCIIFVLYYIVIVPFGLVTKMFGKDFLSKKIDKDSKSYWLKRDSEINDMKYQF